MTRVTLRRRIPLAAEQAFALVADVERYPDFVPYLAACRVMDRGSSEVRVEMVFAFGPLRRRIVSLGHFYPPSRIDITSRDAPFRFFEFHWRFKREAGGTQVKFRAEFAFRSPLWQRLFETYVASATEKIVEAFVTRAKMVKQGDRGVVPSSRRSNRSIGIKPRPE